MRRLVAVLALAAVWGACSTDDGRQLADPDPDLTRTTTAAPTATGEAARGGAAPSFAIPVSSAGPDGLTVSSSAFAAGAAIPVEHTCDGEDTPPDVSWTENGAEQPLALVVRDADADGTVQWLVTDLGGASGVIDPADPTAGTIRANGFGVAGWTGPCPDDALEHRYVFALYALPAGLRLPPDGDADTIVRTIEAEQLGAATLLGVYARG